MLRKQNSTLPVGHDNAVWVHDSTQRPWSNQMPQIESGAERYLGGLLHINLAGRRPTATDLLVKSSVSFPEPPKEAGQLTGSDHAELGKHPNTRETITVTSSVLHETLRAVITRETAHFQHGPSPSSTPNPPPAMRRKNSTSVDQATAWMRKPLPFQTQYCLFSFIAEPLSPTCVCQNDHQYSRDGAGLMETREFDGDEATD